jgi:hypothetical protein
MFSPLPFLCSRGECPNVSLVVKWVAQAWALAAIVSLHTRGGTPTAARSLLWIARMVDAPTGGAAGGGVTVAGGGVCVVAGGGVSVVVEGGVCAVAGGGVSVVVEGGVCVVPPSSAGGVVDVAQLPLASGVEPSGHDCAYEGRSIDNEDEGDCTVRIAAVTRITLMVIIIIDSLLYMICSSCLW